MALEHIVDQMGRQVSVPAPPQRIVSIVPSQTEYLYTIGMGECIVGRTKFCIHPSDRVMQAKVVGGTKSLNLLAIDALRPDIIIGNKEENTREQIEALAERYPIWMSDIQTMEDAHQMMLTLGEICKRQKEAHIISTKIKSGFADLEEKFQGKVAYVIWQDPMMLAGAGTFIHSVLSHLGFNNITLAQRYPSYTLVELASFFPDYIFLSNEPYPFKSKHQREFQKLFPTSKVLLVDGEMFSWYGSRLLLGKQYFKALLENEC